MPRGWEGNRRSGVALAMRHRLSSLSTYGLSGHRKGDEHAPCAVWHPLPGKSSIRDVTNIISTFGVMRIFTTFQQFDIRRLDGSVSVKGEYFILSNLIELY